MIHTGADSGTGTDSGTATTTTTIYAHSDTDLYSMDPKTKTVTHIGSFAGTSGSSRDSSITDLAVNASGTVFVNSETVVYSAALPASGTGTVQLTRLVAIGGSSTDAFYALAFAPSGVLGASETLVAGDGQGEVWSIDPSTGTTKDLGNFGADPNSTSNVLGVSGDFVFYTDSSNTVHGLATIRSCKKSSNSCSTASDYLAAINITNLAANYSGGAPSASLLGGIYGATVSGGVTTGTGPGVGYGDVFGLGAWQGSVFGFTRASSGSSGHGPLLLQIDTTSGVGTIVPSSPGFTSGGWSGAGVTTSVTVVVPPPPAPPQ